MHVSQSCRLNVYLRSFMLATHMMYGLFCVSLLFPFLSADAKNTHIHNWSKQLLKHLGIKLTVHGKNETVEITEILIANHSSWLDIFALNAVEVSRFIAKAEVGSWPLIGRLCKKTGTLFIQRNKASELTRLNKEIEEAVNRGQKIAFFPEGTTSDGLSVLKFKSALIQPIIENKLNVQPVYLRYVDKHGQQTTQAAYFDDISLVRSIRQVLSAIGLTIELHYLEPITPYDHDTRRDLSMRIENAIRKQHSALLV